MIPSKGTNKQSNEGEERVKYQERGGEAEARRRESSDGRGGESGVGWRRRGGGGAQYRCRRRGSERHSHGQRPSEG